MTVLQNIRQAIETNEPDELRSVWNQVVEAITKGGQVAECIDELATQLHNRKGLFNRLDRSLLTNTFRKNLGDSLLSMHPLAPILTTWMREHSVYSESSKENGWMRQATQSAMIAYEKSQPPHAQRSDRIIINLPDRKKQNDPNLPFRILSPGVELTEAYYRAFNHAAIIFIRSYDPVLGQSDRTQVDSETRHANDAWRSLIQGHVLSLVDTQIAQHNQSKPTNLHEYLLSPQALKVMDGQEIVHTLPDYGQKLVHHLTNELIKMDNFSPKIGIYTFHQNMLMQAVQILNTLEFTKNSLKT
jgi:hypothetical protein